jgi:hypothetical protein
MNDQMPMFDDPAPVEQPPKKPRKPMRRKTAKIAAPKKLRKLRKLRAIKPIGKNVGDKYPPHVYRLIGTLMNLEIPLRNFVVEVTKALTNERPS